MTWPVASAASVRPGVPPPLPPGSIVAGVLGLLSGVLASLIGSFVVLLWWSVEESGVLAVAVVVLPIALGHLAGAILVLCGRSPALLVLTAVPVTGVAVLQLVYAGPYGPQDGPSLTWALPLVMGAVAAAAAVTAVGTRRGDGGPPRRRLGALALPEEPRWP